MKRDSKISYEQQTHNLSVEIFRLSKTLMNEFCNSSHSHFNYFLNQDNLFQ